MLCKLDIMLSLLYIYIYNTVNEENIMLESIQSFVETTDPIWQWLAVGLAGAIPYVESYLAAALGVAAGVALPIAIIAACVGNWVSMFALVQFGHSFRERFMDNKEPTGKMLKFKQTFNKYGVVGVSLFGQTLLPSQLTSMGMIALGAPKGKVLFWQTISIIIWGVGFGLLAYAGVNVFQGR